MEKSESTHQHNYEYRVHYKTRVISSGYNSGKVETCSAVCTTQNDCKEFIDSLRQDPTYKIGSIKKMIIPGSIRITDQNGKTVDINTNKKRRKELTYKEMKEKLEYDHENGTLIYKTGRRKGKNAVRFTKNGAAFVYLNGSERSAFRVCWTLYHQEPPYGIVRSINKDKKDIRIKNLRDAG